MLWFFISEEFKTRGGITPATGFKDQFVSAGNGNHKRIFRNTGHIIGHSDDDVLRRFRRISLSIGQRNNYGQQQSYPQQKADWSVEPSTDNQSDRLHRHAI